MKNLACIFVVVVALSLVAGCKGNNLPETPTLSPPTDVYTPTHVPIPTGTSTPTSTPTVTPTSTPRPTATPTPINYVTLGSPFPSDCGDGIPRIWSNDAFNGPYIYGRVDQHHGHVDIFVPEGCDLYNIEREFIAPLPGVFKPEGGSDDDVFLLDLPAGVIPAGIEDALRFAGVEDPDVNRVTDILLNFGHIQVTEVGRHVQKGEPVGEVVGGAYHPTIAYKIYLRYDGTVYELSPTLFVWDTEYKPHPDTWYDTEPEPFDYAPVKE